MRKKMTRFLSLLLVMSMVLSMGLSVGASAEDAEEDDLTVSFVTDGHATVDLYYSKDNYETADETNVTSAYVRGKGSTAIDNSGNGQVNFKVNVDEGYTYDISVSPESGYNNCKGEDETGVADIWRITKISADLTVTITTSAEDSDTVTEQVVIMSTTDVHGKVWDTNLLNDTSVNNSLLNVATAVNEYRDTYGAENVILLDNGDLYQGTPISSYQISQYTQGLTDEMNPMAVALSYIGYDASILGNHEFNYAWDTMSDIYDYLEDNDVSVVCANLYYEDTGERVFDPYLLKTVQVGDQEVTIGIIGLENTDCTRWDVEDNYPGMIFASPENEEMDLAYEVEKVQREWAEAGIDPDLVVVCYHGALGTESDSLSFGVNTENQVFHIIQNTTGVDMVISGHDHSTAYSNNTYENADGEEVLVVNGGGTELTASVWNITVNKTTGETNLTLDDAGAVDIELESSENLTLSDYSIDETLKTMIQSYATAAELYVNTAVGKLLDWDGVANTNSSYYLEQTDTVDLINRAQIYEGGSYLNEKYSSVEELNAALQEMYGEDTEKQFTAEDLVNGELVVDLSSTSVVTTSAPSAGDSELSMKDIYGFYKYDNSLYLLALTGAEIKELLEYNASERIKVSFKNGEAVISDTGDYNANFTFPVFYGLNYTINMAEEEGSRVTITGFSNGKQFSEDGVYIFAVNNYHLGNTYNEILGQWTTSDAIWSQTDDLGGGYVQDLIASYVSEMTETYGGVYGTAEAEKNGESSCTWSIVYDGEIPTGTVISDDTAYVGTLTEALSDGDEVMIYNLYNDYAVSSDAYSSTTLSVAAGTVDADTAYVEDSVAIFTVGITEQGYYTFLTDQGYLTSAPTGSGLFYSEQATEYSLWELIEVSEGVYSVKNVSALYNGTSAQFLEYYQGKFTTYGGGASGGSAFEVSFYTVQTAGTLLEDPTTLADGDNILIYYEYGSTVLGVPDGSRLTAVETTCVSTESGGSLVIPESGALVFTVGVTEDGYYTFSTEDGYLTSGASGNSLSFAQELTELGCWELEQADGGWYVHNVGANYNGTYNQYLEYYSGFTTYGLSSNTSAYIFNLYKVGAVGASSGDQEDAGPEQTDVNIAVGSDETERNITWYANVEGTGTLYLAKESDLVNGAMPDNAAVYSTTGVTSTTKSGYDYYQVSVTGLESGTTYAYQLANGETISEVYTFTTGADDGSFTFALVGDPQIGAGSTASDIEGWEDTLTYISGNMTDAEFILSVGDQVNTADSETEYSGFLSTVLSSMTLATVIGNHDTNSIAYSEHFDITNASEYGSTAAGTDYYFVYENVLFLVLNSNNSSAAEHQAFMKQAIAEAEAEYDIDWKVVTFHHSVYSVASHATEDSILSLRNSLVPIFTELDIDVVLMGHDHVYCRTYMMDGLEVMDDASIYDDESYSSITDPSGILYVTVNSASGSKYYNIQENVDFEYAAVMNQDKERNVSQVTVTETSFTITTYAIENGTEVVDTFTINRTAGEESESYTVTAAEAENGTVTVSPASAAAGESVTVTAEPDEGYELVSLTVTDAEGNEIAVTDGVFTMPASAVTVTAVFQESTGGEEAHTHTYEGSVEKTEPTCTEDGSYVITVACTECGDEAYTCTVTIPATGHTYGEGTVTVAATRYTTGVMSYTCTVCGETFTTKIAKTGASFLFDDVTNSGSYYYEKVYWAYDLGITTGTSANLFSPSATCTRGQFVTFLYRLAQATGADTSVTITGCDFTDVSSSASYYQAMLWAVENEITNGTTNTTFSPSKTITRAQAVTMLYRYEKNIVNGGVAPTVSTTSTDYTDVVAGSFYEDAVFWAVENGITDGTSDTTFSPTQNCTRAMMVTFLYRFAVEPLSTT